MLVYGDPSRDVALHSALDSLGARAAALEPGPGATASLDLTREWLIEAGQLEQAIADHRPDSTCPDPRLADATRLTDAAARAFVARFEGTGSLEKEWRQIRASLRALRDAPNVMLRQKLPEGFAFYALYPEQYCQAAHQCLAEHSEARKGRVVVVGVRSIGTTLSAVVAAVLNRGGWEAHRLTVRPGGHPFDRRIGIPPAELRGAAWAIVADEGPGLSGSSMAACARALAAGGLPPDRICFFPGHAGMPGPQAPAEVRGWWERVSRRVVGWDAIRWEGRSLTQVLSDATERLCERRAIETEDLSGGTWRRVAYGDEARWPAVGAAFERMKVRVVLEDRSSILWKFCGLGSADEACRQSALARAGFAPAPLGRVLGFVGCPWIEGERLMAGGADPPIDRIAGYVRAAARPAMQPPNRRAAFDRLRELIRVNVAETLDEAAGGRALAIADAAAPVVQGLDLPCYGDGRMAPHEWVRAGYGRILKTDCGGHFADHTIVGRQPVLWDVAGAIVEWRLDRRQSESLLARIELAASGESIEFYQLAYCAFWAGFCVHCAQASDSDERARLERAASIYGSRIAALLPGATAHRAQYPGCCSRTGPTAHSRPGRRR